MNRLDKPTESPVSVKKAYSKPELQVYGDLRDITGAVGNMGRDGGTMKFHGTS